MNVEREEAVSLLASKMDKLFVNDKDAQMKANKFLIEYDTLVFEGNGGDTLLEIDGIGDTKIELDNDSGEYCIHHNEMSWTLIPA